MEVTVFLKNPPSRATEWQLFLYDWNKAQIGSRSGIPITDSAVFEVPAGTIFPLRVDMLIYHNGTIDYRMQSMGTVFPFPAESYVEAFIPESGSYYYNVATEQFESIAPEEGPFSSISITAPSSAEEGERVSVSTRVTNISAVSRLFRMTLYAVRDIFEFTAPDERIGSMEVAIESGQSQVVSGSFIMPAWDTNFLVMVHQFTNFWDFDNYATEVVSSEILVPEYPATDIKNITISVIGVEYPSTDIRNISISVLGVEYPSTDIRNISIEVVGIPVTPPPPGEEEEEEEEEVEEKKFPWVPAVLIGGGVAGLVVGSGIGTNKTKGG